MFSAFAKKIRVVAGGNVRMRAQTPLQVVPADVAQQRILGIAIRAAGLLSQIGGQGVDRDHRIELRAEEKGYRQALADACHTLLPR